MALTDVDGTLAAAGIAIDAPGLACEGKALGKVIDLKTPAVQLLHDTLANSGLSVTNHIRLTHSASSSEAVRITVPAPAFGFNALLLVHDSTGAISWHTPEGLEPTSELVEQPVFVEAPTTAEAGMSGRRVSFEVPQGRFTVDAHHPGFLSRVTGLVEHFHFRPTVTGLTKVLTVVEYPVEHLVGKEGFKLFKRWEDNKHPHVLRWFPARGA